MIALGCGSKPAPAAAPQPESSAAAAPAPSPKASKSEPPAPSMENDEQRVLLPRDQVAEYFRLRRPSDKPGTFFTPTQAEIGKLEDGLPAMIRDELSGKPATSPPLWERAKTYKRQYVAFVDAGGTHWIWGNFFCTNPGRPGSDKWRNKIVTPDHGGDCFFNVEFSPDTGKFRYFKISD
jgi:hypothetical protein